MNNKLAMLIGIGLVALSGAAYSANSAGKAVANGKPFAIINEEVVELRSMVDDIDARVGELEAGFEEMSGDIDDLSFTLGAYESYVETRLTELGTAISQLETKDAELDAEIEAIVATLAEQDASILDLFAQYTQLSNELNALLSQGNIQAIKAQIDLIKSQLAQLAGDLSDLDDGLADALYDIGVNAGAIEALEIQQENFAAFIEQLEGSCGEDEFIREVQESGSTVCYPQSAGSSSELERVYVIGVLTSVPIGYYNTSRAACPSSHPVLATGGYSSWPAVVGFNVSHSTPSNALIDGEIVEAHYATGRNGSNTSVDISARAICMQGVRFGVALHSL